MRGKVVATLGTAGLIALIGLADANHPSHNRVFDQRDTSVPGHIAPSLPSGPAPDWHPAPADQVTVPTTTTK